MKRNMLAIVCGLSLTIGAYALGHQTSPVRDKVLEYRLAYETTDVKAQLVASGAAKASELSTIDPVGPRLSAIAADPKVTPDLLTESVKLTAIHKASAQSAAQVTQVYGESAYQLQLLQVAQNARIIALLEQLNKAKK